VLIQVIKFSDILSLSIEKYINDNSHLFLKENNRYILTSPFKINIIHSYINATITSMLSGAIQDNVYIVGECYYYNNWRTQLEYDRITNGKRALLDKKTCIKYILKERDIKIDELRLNHIAESFFNKKFKDAAFSNIKYLKHRHLTEDDLLYIFTKLFNDKTLKRNEIDNNILQKINDILYITPSSDINSKYIKIITCLIDSFN
jgi:hypothetical protein